MMMMIMKTMGMMTAGRMTRRNISLLSFYIFYFLLQPIFKPSLTFLQSFAKLICFYGNAKVETIVGFSFLSSRAAYLYI